MDVKFFRFMSQETMYENASYSKTSIPTPPNIVRDMLDLVPKELWGNKDAKVLNLACKDGNFLYRACELFMEGLKHEIPDEQERLNHIINNCLYACICRDTDIQGKWLGLVDIEKIYNLGCCLDLPESNIFVVDTGKWGLEFYSSNIEKESVEMPKFDLVIGNPPYNNDLYLDFVLQAQELSKDKVVMVTPAKWQGKPDDKNADFRNAIVPYMSTVVYYPDTYEIFKILPQGGITYFALNNNKVAKTSLVNVHKGNRKALEVSDFSNNLFLNIDSLSIKDKVINHKDFKSIAYSDDFVPQKSYFYSGQPSREAQKVRDDNGGYFVKNDRTSVPVNKSIFKHQDEVDNYKVYCSFFLNASTTSCHLYAPNEVAGRASALLGFGSKEKCESIKKYYQTKLISYLMYVFSNTGCLNESVWYFVPDPEDWSMEYEDSPLKGYTPDSDTGIYIDNEGKKHCSLYVKYGLSEDEINIIESTIKERA